MVAKPVVAVVESEATVMEMLLAVVVAAVVVVVRNCCYCWFLKLEVN